MGEELNDAIEARGASDVAGLRAPSNLPTQVRAHLTELLAFVAEARTLDVDDSAHEAAFDPRWPVDDAVSTP